MVNPTSPPPDPPDLATPTKTNTLACRVAKVKKYLLSVPDQRWAPSWIKVMEHQSVSTPIGILGGLFGVFFAPMVYLCGLWIIIGIHRSGVVDKLSRLRQIATYLLAATFLAITLHLGVQRVQNLLLQEKQSWISQLAAKINPARFGPPAVDAQPRPLTKDDLQEALKSLLREADAKLPPSPPPHNRDSGNKNNPFYVSVEATIASASRTGKPLFDGFWVGNTNSVKASNHAYFVRIQNLQSSAVTISRLNITPSNKHCSEFDRNGFERLDTLNHDVFFTIDKGQGVPVVGRSFQIPADNTATYSLLFNSDNADMVHAAHLNLPLIDQLLASGYLQPNTGGVRGWVFVWSYCMSMDFDIQLTDTLDHTYLYHVIHSNDTKQGDIMMRTMTVDGLVDLSNSAKHLGSLPF